MEIHDDGIGGAEFGSDRSGLIGLRDRIGALEGSFALISPSGESGTSIIASIPIPG
ncbi:MAG: hypothetical protein JO325_08600 [Solirubrobacterales bacterium]|nr:hypothetical protein [Solirubrobacterales bacterium]